MFRLGPIGRMGNKEGSTFVGSPVPTIDGGKIYILIQTRLDNSFLSETRWNFTEAILKVN